MRHRTLVLVSLVATCAAPGVSVLSDRDGAAIAGASLSRSGYSARITVGVDEMLKGATPGAAAAADTARDNFGCRLVQIDPGASGAVKATVLCGKNFYKGVLQTTGTMVHVR